MFLTIVQRMLLWAVRRRLLNKTVFITDSKGVAMAQTTVSEVDYWAPGDIRVVLVRPAETMKTPENPLGIRLERHTFNYGEIYWARQEKIFMVMARTGI